MLARALIFNRLRAIWSKGYQRGSLGRVTRTATTSKQAMRKSCLPAGIEPAAFGAGSIPAGRSKAAGSIPVGRQLFRIACFEVVAVLVTLPRLPRW